MLLVLIQLFVTRYFVQFQWGTKTFYLSFCKYGFELVV